MSDAQERLPVSLAKDPAAGGTASGGARPAGPAAPAAPAPEGCLAVVIRIPVRIVTLLLVLPVRMLWDALIVCGRALKRTLWVPFARAMSRLWDAVLAPVLYAVFVWPWTALWRYVLAPVGRGAAWLAALVGSGIAAAARGIGAALSWLGRTLLVIPATWLYRQVLTPVGHGILAVLRGAGSGLAWLGRYGLLVPGKALWAAAVWLVGLLVVVPAVFLYRWVLTPLGHGVIAAVRAAVAALAWLWRYAVLAPCGFVYRWILAPVGRAAAVVAREIADALGHAWRVAGRISRAVFRFIGAVLRFLVVDPVVWVWRNAVRPLGRGLRDHVWRPVARAVREAGRGVRAAFAAARDSVRQTRAELRRALFGAPSEPERQPLPGNGRVPWGAGSPHSRASASKTPARQPDDADFRTL
ncbi:hypothetical protein [Streptomyces daqingensis]|uniref:hypothetical protein n=1 Tax=Streptomyces daqingensis TaxID=1472640 RepID=UPI00166649D8|nr:hypothetical protein [Streptomyces daqingensis]